MDSRTRRLASYLMVVLLFAGSLFRLDQIDRDADRRQRANEARLCALSQDNRAALIKVVTIALRPQTAPEGAAAAAVEQTRAGNAVRAKIQAEILVDLTPIRCPA